MKEKIPEELRKEFEQAVLNADLDHWMVDNDRQFLDKIWDAVDKLFNQEVEKQIKEIDQHGRIAASVIKKKLWSMRFNEEDVKKETDGRRKRFIYGYTEAINDISQWLTEMVDICRRSRLTQKKEGGGNG